MNGLQKHLCEVIGGEYWGPQRSYLQRVIQMVGYYSQNDLNDAEKGALNQLNAILYKADRIEYLAVNFPPFSRGIRMDNLDKGISREAVSAWLEVTKPFMEMDTCVDIASLLGYIKRKAVEAGDWPLEYD